MSGDQHRRGIGSLGRSYTGQSDDCPTGVPVSESDDSSLTASSQQRNSFVPQYISVVTSNLINSGRTPPASLPTHQPHRLIDGSLREIAQKYEIRDQLSQQLRALEDYKIIIVCDDSGSMKTTVDNTNRTRWDELCEIVKVILEIGVIFDSSGVDIYFLNREAIPHVTDPTIIDQEFNRPPRGFTPLVPVLRKIFRLPITHRRNDKKVLVFVATDGAPTDDKGEPNVDELEHIMNEVRIKETTFVEFLICTDDPNGVDYLVDWDKKMINVDVTDDFHSERVRVRNNRGENYPFSIGDYIVKALVGAIVPAIDELDG